MLIVRFFEESQRSLTDEYSSISLQFVVLLYLLTYVGVLTTGLTLVITGKLYFCKCILYRHQHGGNSELQRVV